MYRIERAFWGLLAVGGAIAVGLTTHDALPSSAAAFREAKLAVDHLPPTCRDLLTRVADSVVPLAVHQGEQSAGRTVAVVEGEGALP